MNQEFKKLNELYISYTGLFAKFVKRMISSINKLFLFQFTKIGAHENKLLHSVNERMIAIYKNKCLDADS